MCTSRILQWSAGPQGGHIDAGTLRHPTAGTQGCLNDRVEALLIKISRSRHEVQEQFRTLVKQSGTEIIRLPPMSPNLNAYAERFVRSIKDEGLGRTVLLGQD